MFKVPFTFPSEYNTRFGCFEEIKWLTKLRIILNFSMSISPEQSPHPEKKGPELVKVIFVIIYSSFYGHMQ